MRKIIFLIYLLCLLMPLALYAQNIDYVEYFIDTEPGFGNGTEITIDTPDTNINLNFTIDISNISDGFHTLYIRGRSIENDTIHWGLAHIHPFYKMSASAGAKIVDAEYFIDVIPDFGDGTPITISQQDTSVVMNLSVSVANLNDGFHTLYIRAMDENGHWSISHVHPFYKMTVDAQAQIIQAEYYIDDIPAFGSGTPITVSQQDTAVVLNIPINIIAGFKTSGFFLMLSISGSLTL